MDPDLKQWGPALAVRPDTSLSCECIESMWIYLPLRNRSQGFTLYVMSAKPFANTIICQLSHRCAAPQHVLSCPVIAKEPKLLPQLEQQHQAEHKGCDAGPSNEVHRASQQHPHLIVFIHHSLIFFLDARAVAFGNFKL